MKIILIICLSIFLFSCSEKSAPDTSVETEQNWTHYVRTSGHGLNKSNIERTIKDAQDTYLFGIEVDNDPPGRYESFLDPTEKLEAIALMAKRAHEINNHAFLYVAGLECITANADKTEHSFFKDHPDWVQRDINDRPAMFGGGDAFWISEGDEDVWITPYALEWRKIYMEHIRKIAKTGIDGIFVDIPYWMTHFDGWEDTWASFDVYTVAEFKKQTRLDAKTDLKLGDFSDPNFRKWVDFRMSTLTEFMAEVNRTAKSVNPEIKVIAEIYPGLGEEAVRVGADVYQMYDAVDVVAHEFSGGGGNAASKNPLNWFSRMAGMYTFRAFAQGKASWMLSYSWGDRNKVSASESIKNLMLSNVMAGTNCWDARGHVMSGSNDIDTRREVFKWISENENVFYKPRTPIKPIGIYFSPKSRDYFAGDFMTSYQGMLYMMLQGHVEFEIVTPRTLKEFEGEILILPDVKCISQEEVDILGMLMNSGTGLIATAETGKYDEAGNKYKTNPVQAMAEQISETGDYTYAFYVICPGKRYTELCKRDFDQSAWSGKYEKSKFTVTREQFLSDLTGKFAYEPEIKIEASPFISAQMALVESRPHVFLANYRGLKKDEVAIQIPEEGIKISFPAKSGANVYFLPYLGEKVQLQTQTQGEQLECVLPAIEKGGVVWAE